MATLLPPHGSRLPASPPSLRPQPHHHHHLLLLLLAASLPSVALSGNAQITMDFTIGCSIKMGSSAAECTGRDIPNIPAKLRAQVSAALLHIADAVAAGRSGADDPSTRADAAAGGGGNIGRPRGGGGGVQGGGATAHDNWADLATNATATDAVSAMVLEAATVSLMIGGETTVFSVPAFTRSMGSTEHACGLMLGMVDRGGPEGVTEAGMRALNQQCVDGFDGEIRRQRLEASVALCTGLVEATSKKAAVGSSVSHGSGSGAGFGSASPFIPHSLLGPHRGDRGGGEGGEGGAGELGGQRELFRYYSQEGQDRIAHQIFFPCRGAATSSKGDRGGQSQTGGTGGGFFVDVGAHDGRTFSNSMFMEEELGWSGICIEANPSILPRLRRNRPDCAVVAAAAGGEAGTTRFRQVEGPAETAEMLSGVEGAMHDKHRVRVTAAVQQAATQGHVSAQRTIEVRVVIHCVQVFMVTLVH